MKKYISALHRAEGTIAAASGGRRSWDSVTLKQTALAAMAGGKPPFGNSSPEEWEAMASAYAKIQARTSEEIKGWAASR
jgi:hypothetical protein